MWKTDFEKTSNSTFVLHSAPNNLADHQCYYIYCNRSGTYNSRGKGKRSLQLQGSSKIGRHCIAYIRA